MRRLAHFLQRAPWLVVIARTFWRFTRPKFSAGAVGVVFDDQGRILLVEHVFHPYCPWGLPGGWVDRHENPAQTVCRELQEELELPVEVEAVLLVAVEYGNHLDFAYKCVAAGNVGKLSRELLDYAWYDPKDLPRLQSFHYRAIQLALKLNQTNNL
jgi:8-oxo-dGTP diphosphatase